MACWPFGFTSSRAFVFQCSKESFGQSLGEVVEEPPLEVDTASDGLSNVSEGDLSEGGEGTTGSADTEESDDTETEATAPPPSPYSVRRSDGAAGRRVTSVNQRSSER
eukprot:s396_g3.t1